MNEHTYINTQLKSAKAVIEAERECIMARRRSRHQLHEDESLDNMIGIALSGGGIRSATLNLGVLRVLEEFHILEKADYLSTVSGGGYTGSYLISKINMLRQEYKRGVTTTQQIITEADVVRLRKYGEYLAPGRGRIQFFNRVMAAGAITASFLMNLVWIVLLFLTVFGIFSFAGRSIGQWMYHVSDTVMEVLTSIWSPIQQWIPTGVVRRLIAYIPHNVYDTFAPVVLPTMTIVFLGTVGYHYVFHVARRWRIWSSDMLNRIEGVLLVIVVASVGCYYLTMVSLVSRMTPIHIGASALLLWISGYLANPNILSIHRFYRDRLADAYLDLSDGLRLKLHKVFPDEQNDAEIRRAPYPPYLLVNTCLNLLDVATKNFHGVKTSDYFLLSPRYCGSGLTGYIHSKSVFYNHMTLSTAMATSAAAVNPLMGRFGNPFFAFLMTLLNLQTGYWTLNPGSKSTWWNRLTWWPHFLMRQLFNRIDEATDRVSISDGGHIENLAVYELLRRRCRLIIAVDASDDPDYTFPDLANLIRRARSELGIVISFSEGAGPEDRIVPSPSRSFANAHFAVGSINFMEGMSDDGKPYDGIFVYVKSSLTKQQTWRNYEPDSNDPADRGYVYKTYHPLFPHESTIDQFFDEDQWNAYYYLGRFIAADVLDVKLSDTNDLQSKKMKYCNMSFTDLATFFASRKTADSFPTTR